MYVLLDIEWVTVPSETPKPGHWLTQLSAARMDETRKVLERFDGLIRPIDPDSCDWSFIAYSGYAPEQFCMAESEEECIKGFDKWLKNDDVFLCWHEETKRMLHEAYRRHLGHKCPIHSIRIKYGAEKWLRENGAEAKGLYAAAKACGWENEELRHCSYRDVDLLQTILSHIDLPFEKYAEAYPTPQKQTWKLLPLRERNAKRMETIGLPFLYTPNSKVFHRYGCKLLLGAKEISGCKHYQTAAQQRRPCKVCKPVPLRGGRKTRVHLYTSGQRPKGKTVYMDCVPDKPTEDPELFVVTLLGGKQKKMDPQDLVGCCHSSVHPGKITVNMLWMHQCAKKQCKYFEPYKDTRAWKTWRRDANRRYKRRQKEKKAAEMEQKAEETASNDS